MSLLELPQELVTYILHILGRPDLCVSALTCTTFLRALEPAIADPREACRRGCVYSICKLLNSGKSLAGRVIDKCIRDAIEFDHACLLPQLYKFSQFNACNLQRTLLEGASRTGRQAIIDLYAIKDGQLYDIFGPIILVGLCSRKHYDLALEYLKAYKFREDAPGDDWFYKICGHGDIVLCRRLITDPDYEHLYIREDTGMVFGAYCAAKYGHIHMIEFLSKTFPDEFDRNAYITILCGAIKGSHQAIISQLMTAHNITVEEIIQEASRSEYYESVVWALHNGARFKREYLHFNYTPEENAALLAYASIKDIKQFPSRDIVGPMSTKMRTKSKTPLVELSYGNFELTVHLIPELPSYDYVMIPK